MDKIETLWWRLPRSVRMLVIVSGVVSPLALLGRCVGEDEQEKVVEVADPRGTMPPPAGSPQTHTAQASSSGQSTSPTTHTVRKGEFLIGISNSYGVPWEGVMLLNETELARRAEERCGKLSKRYTHRTRGYYCNETRYFRGRPMASANSLQPGDVLQIPAQTTPQNVAAAIVAIPGERIAVVIDDTGSMDDDRQRVGAWYTQAIRNSGKKIVRVILYADGRIREYDAGSVQFQVNGNVENTRGALEYAAGLQPDAIVLISDEPGDDWGNFRGLRLPPVIAHSLNPYADENLERVAQLTGGQFLRSHAGAIAGN